MSTGATIAVAILSSGAFSAIVTTVCNAIVDNGKRKRQREDRERQINERLDAFTKQLKKIQEHAAENHLTGLRLTIMSGDMPMSERLIAGEKYVAEGGNGDVKRYYNELKKRCNDAAQGE